MNARTFSPKSSQAKKELPPQRRNPTVSLLERASLQYRPIAHRASKCRFSSGASAAIQDSAALPSMLNLCRSAARSNLCRLASETCDAWNRADPSFDT